MRKVLDWIAQHNLVAVGSGHRQHDVLGIVLGGDPGCEDTFSCCHAAALRMSAMASSAPTAPATSWVGARRYLHAASSRTVASDLADEAGVFHYSVWG
jgi:hypothetical protein